MTHNNNYDSNGNITAIKRFGSSASAPLEDLQMSYSGNTLTSVGSASFSYDSAGNLASDPLRGQTLSYNILSLPCSISTSSDEADYTYLADGTKAQVLGEQSEDGYAYLGSMVFALSEGDWIFDSTPYSGGRIRNDGGSWVADRYVTDHLGSVRVVVRGGQVIERNDFYPYGGRHANPSLTADATNRWRFSCKEIQTTAGVNLLDFGARLYDDRTCCWTTRDPMSEKYYGFSPYNYCAGDPVNLVDPEGMSTFVIRQSDGTYVVSGGDMDDDDLSVYEGYWEGESFVKERAIGVTPTMTSFYNSDSTAENKWMVGTVIDLNDRSGIIFLSGLINDTPTLWNYMVNALPGGLYDFKVSNGQTGYNGDKNKYRGMPLGDGIIASARDIGNIGAGYIAGVNGISYEAARFAFDLLESTQHLPTDNYSRPIYHSNDDYPALFYHQEGVSTQNAELFGWKMGAFHRNKKKYYGKSCVSGKSSGRFI